MGVPHNRVPTSLLGRLCFLFVLLFSRSLLPWNGKRKRIKGKRFSQSVDERLERSQFLNVFRFQLCSLPHHRLDAAHGLADFRRAERVCEAFFSGSRGVSLGQEEVPLFQQDDPQGVEVVPGLLAEVCRCPGAAWFWEECECEFLRR